MLLCEARSELNDGDCFETSSVGEELPKVDVISSSELIFDQNPRVSPEILAQDVRPKRTNGAFLRLKRQINPKRLTEYGEICRLSEPWREIGSLITPYAS